MIVPDRAGKFVDVLLGHDRVHDWMAGHMTNFNSVVGRYANRIANAKFTLNGKTYSLPSNDGPNCEHGGPGGFWMQVFDLIGGGALPSGDGVFVELSHTSPEDHSGFPGTVTATVRYELNDRNELRMVMSATTTATTHVSLCNHSYWNLGGHHSGDVLQHKLQIASTAYTPTNDNMIPTGIVAPVKDTPLDFSESTPIGDRIGEFKDNKVLNGGYDHNYVLTPAAEHTRTPPLGSDGVKFAAKLHDPNSGTYPLVAVSLITVDWTYIDVLLLFVS